MQELIVGQPYPMPYPHLEGMTPVLDGASLTFLVTLAEVSDSDSEAFRRGSLEYGLFVDLAIPILLCNFRGCAEFDAYINIHSEPQTTRDAFLAGDPDSNRLIFFLVDSRTGILRGIRTIGAPRSMLPEAKAACFEQLTRYRPQPLSTQQQMALCRGTASSSS